MKLTGRTILITGGSAGIGLAFALKFLDLGNKVIVTGRRQHVLDKVKAGYPRLHTIRGDVANPAQVSAVARQVKEEFPRLDVLMNNAGIGHPQNLRQTSGQLDSLTSEMDVNVGGVIRMTSALVDILTANSGTIINVSSMLAFAPVPALPIYSATKAAVHSYTQSLRFQLEDSGVEVIELMPPAIQTNMTSEFPEEVSKITTDELVRLSFAALKAGTLEIRPGQTNQAAFMRRLAPDFLNRQLWRASKAMVPVSRLAGS